MLNTNLVIALVEKKIIGHNTLIGVRPDPHNPKSLDKIIKRADECIFVAGGKYIPADEVELIDGMDIKRLLKVYGLNPKGKSEIVEVKHPTDVEKEYVGQPSGKLGHHNLKEGMKVLLHADKTEKYNNVLLTVRGVGKSIKFAKRVGRPKKDQG